MVVTTFITSKKQIVKKTVNRQIYVYERTPYYDKSLKNTKYHCRYVKREINDETKKIRNILSRSPLIYGPFIPLMKISESIGLRNMLKTYLTEDECKRRSIFVRNRHLEIDVNTGYNFPEITGMGFPNHIYNFLHFLTPLSLLVKNYFFCPLAYRILL